MCVARGNMVYLDIDRTLQSREHNSFLMVFFEVYRILHMEK